MSLFRTKNSTIKAFEELGDINKYSSIVSYGIVNPFGPTMTVLAVELGNQKKENISFVLLQLHPFFPLIIKKWILPFDDSVLKNGISQIINEICTSEEFDSSCPTFLIPGIVIEEDRSKDILARIVSSKRGGKDVFERCKRFPGNAMDRVTDEIQSMLKPATEERLSIQEAKEFVNLQLREKSFQSELTAFIAAYTGAIQHVSMLPVGLPFNDFSKILTSVILGQE